ncbi:uncharacterized protein [Typha angustifolia]|uniref:uncharacterized protein n=1 Tax=Typha angustifolia TaxID=59011 RepID=UPI003C2D082D
MSYYSCKSATGCVDARIPVRASYVNLYKWPESDAEFMKSVTRRREDHSFNNRACSAGPEVVDSYSCRQLYLRSYTFSKKKETVPEKTMRCFGKVKEKAAVFPLFIPQNKNNIESSDHKGKDKDKKGNNNKKKKKKKRNKDKICIRLKKLRQASYSAMCSIFCRILSCSASVDVADRSPA